MVRSFSTFSLGHSTPSLHSWTLASSHTAVIATVCSFNSLHPL